ncbi:unnamed protein product [Darwinula stevensoni]|uniref:Uncharacterized protein n=1 Tax=Darwinula stevensoni TaxID=69355 RepID=A0A7R9AAS8_9CRUS|nr:unnamed protein product [Darwinula stevensoni]CAG0898715.1 unnamed protein product [Darwinula stevensoni]
MADYSYESTYLRHGEYPSSMKSNPGAKSNLRRKAQSFCLIGGVLHKKGKAKVERCVRCVRVLMTMLSSSDVTKRVMENIEEQEHILKACHEGVGDSLETKALGGHIGIDKMELKLLVTKFFEGVCSSCGERRVSLRRRMPNRLVMTTRRPSLPGEPPILESSSGSEGSSPTATTTSSSDFSEGHQESPESPAVVPSVPEEVVQLEPALAGDADQPELQGVRDDLTITLVFWCPGRLFWPVFAGVSKIIAAAVFDRVSNRLCAKKLVVILQKPIARRARRPHPYAGVRVPPAPSSDCPVSISISDLRAIVGEVMDARLILREPNASRSDKVASDDLPQIRTIEYFIVSVTDLRRVVAEEFDRRMLAPEQPQAHPPIKLSETYGIPKLVNQRTRLRNGGHENSRRGVMGICKNSWILISGDGPAQIFRNEKEIRRCSDGSSNDPCLDAKRVVKGIQRTRLRNGGHENSRRGVMGICKNSWILISGDGPAQIFRNEKESLMRRDKLDESEKLKGCC